jgi:hypothetical protein
MTKTLNQIIFFSSIKIRIFFQQQWESEYIFRNNLSLVCLYLSLYISLLLFVHLFLIFFFNKCPINIMTNINTQETDYSV